MPNLMCNVIFSLTLYALLCKPSKFLTVMLCQYHAGRYMVECSRTNLKLITFVMMNMGNHVTARMSLIWTGSLHLQILVKRKHLIGISKTLITMHILYTCFFSVINSLFESSIFLHWIYTFLKSWSKGERQMLNFRCQIEAQGLWYPTLNIFQLLNNGKEWGLKLLQLLV